jgi:hypothetical protein
MNLPAPRPRDIFIKTILQSLIVIPAKAGIQKKKTTRFRIKCGMTE